MPLQSRSMIFPDQLLSFAAIFLCCVGYYDYCHTVA